MKNLFVIIVLSVFHVVNGQRNTNGYWQQHVDYTMEVEMDVDTFNYSGTQQIIYTNNSPDILQNVFFHLYFNAFQPGSEMDVRSRTIADPDRRVMNRIQNLAPEDQGFLNVLNLTQDGEKLKTTLSGTILEVELKKPILSGEQTTFEMNFEGQVPLNVRRSGKNSSEGVVLSMAQWYPKLAEYDFEGWHADPYIGREFHGVWGNFDLKLTIDNSYIVGGTGYLQNEKDIKIVPVNKKKKRKNTNTWHFVAPNVHDFTWAADPDYIHDKLQIENGPMLHFYYKSTLEKEYQKRWRDLQPITAKLMAFFNENIGVYPYKQYSVIQGGDGGMEYGMCTLITGVRSFESLVGVTSHELAHTWFQFLMATNEGKHPWMDEGFTEYICTMAEVDVMNIDEQKYFERAYKRYVRYALSGFEQPQSTHADRYEYNAAYGTSSYVKGAIFLRQLKYIIGEKAFRKTLHDYFNSWSFKHPTPNDFIRCAEKASGLELDWYLTDWTRTDNVIDYGIKSVEKNEQNTEIVIERIGLVPMPTELEIEYADGEIIKYYIPLRMMRGEKPTDETTIVLNDWAWAYPTYSLLLNNNKEVKKITLDPEKKVADINLDNNSLVLEKE
ncbi:MAG: M1 family metallopeptidase [Bacteroidetes bacterium]|nr:M1 family metallopeptidase [Bacteroidota bacterium]MDA0860280.1 M1 family metallopeptidase [Bacteroidota bacterium]MDA1318488.1 M1 family metallopeptidase [Bacteroidota bacterium]